jgi:hypothetical protein
MSGFIRCSRLSLTNFTLTSHLSTAAKEGTGEWVQRIKFIPSAEGQPGTQDWVTVSAGIKAEMMVVIGQDKTPGKNETFNANLIIACNM